MRKNSVNRKIYAVYKGDDYIMEGTPQEIAEKRGISMRSMRFLLTPSYSKFVDSINARNGKRLRLVLVDELVEEL